MLCARVPFWALLPFLLVFVRTPQGDAVASCEADFDSVSLVQLKAPLRRSHAGKLLHKAPANLDASEDAVDDLDDDVVALSDAPGAAAPLASPINPMVVPAQATALVTTAPSPATTMAEQIEISLDYGAFTTAPATVTTRTEEIDISLNIPTAAASTTTTTPAPTSTLKYEISLDIETKTVTTTPPPPTTRTMVINIYLDEYTSTTVDYTGLMNAQAAQQAKSQQIVSEAQAEAKEIVAQAKTPAAVVKAQKEADQIIAKAKVAATPPPVPAPYLGPEPPQQPIGLGIQTTSSAPPPSPSMTTTANLAAAPCVMTKNGGVTPAPPPYLSPVSVIMNGTNIIVTTTQSPPPTLHPMANYSAADLKALNASRYQASLDCALSSWGDWSVCSATSGMVTKFARRERMVVNPQQKGGRACTEPKLDQRACKE